jgi:anti-anti-sigma regulatory factor
MARKQQGDIKLTYLKPFIKEIFDISRFMQIFNLFDIGEAAVKNFEEK